MTTTRVAHRYAKALMEIAKDENSFDAVVEDIRTIGAAIDGSQELRQLLISPVIEVHTKAVLLRQIFAGKVGIIMDRFITLLTRKGRSVDLPAIVAAFEGLLDEERNVVRAEITTASVLDTEQQGRIERRLEKLSGHSVRASYTVDPSIIGGFTARFTDTMLDASVRHQLDRLRHAFIEGNVN